jgi:hypothetical protein
VHELSVQYSDGSVPILRTPHGYSCGGKRIQRRAIQL